jgi:hypothetical protein
MPMSRNVLAAIGATLVVVAVVILGFRVLGGPSTQRLVQADLRTVRALAQLAGQIELKWSSTNKVLPANLDQFPSSEKQNPITKKLFDYRPKSNSEYELCTTFLTNSRDLQPQNTPDSWAHPGGDYCFHLDATQPVQQVPYFY